MNTIKRIECEERLLKSAVLTRRNIAMLDTHTQRDAQSYRQTDGQTDRCVSDSKHRDRSVA